VFGPEERPIATGMSKLLRNWFIGQWTGRRCQYNYTEWTTEQ